MKTQTRPQTKLHGELLISKVKQGIDNVDCVILKLIEVLHADCFEWIEPRTTVKNNNDPCHSLSKYTNMYTQSFSIHVLLNVNKKV